MSVYFVHRVRIQTIATPADKPEGQLMVRRNSKETLGYTLDWSLCALKLWSQVLEGSPTMASGRRFQISMALCRKLRSRLLVLYHGTDRQWAGIDSLDRVFRSLGAGH